uniref:Uncharacterized protein n=1 Tax=Noccaea caerulescens TaxID=107243 RepID=A0A1J3JGY0_NOCCA
MKREGRQHGVVRTLMVIPSDLNLRPKNRFDSPPGFGVFTKVPSKPTNHSKFTGKCEKSKWSNWHGSPATTKSAGKSKGHRKLHATAWWGEDKLDRFVGSDPSSAISILDKLCGEDYDGY